ncbi:MAG TPA: hypothetical protein VJU61_06575, partial [Polyangiaceae bacterium]|nr:hypothetical protein [Polyangiaceae bacterium]
MTLTPQQFEELAHVFAQEGYLRLPNIVDKAALLRHRDELLQEFDRAKRAGELFSGGGMVSGHLNCFPGAQTRSVYRVLEDAGVLDLVRRVSPQAARLPNVGCNMNLPGSSAQNVHIDGYASTAFMIVNVAPLDIDL